MSESPPGDAADKAVDEFFSAILAAIAAEIASGKPSEYVRGLDRALSIVKEIWQQ